MICDDIQQKLTPYLFRELKVDAIHRVNEHLKGCPVCHEEADRLRKAVAYLRVDPGIESSEERLEGLLVGLRPRFSAMASQRVLRAGVEGAPAGPRITWMGLVACLVPTVGLFGLLLLADVGGLRTRLLAAADADRDRDGQKPSGFPEYERRPEDDPGEEPDPNGAAGDPGVLSPEEIDRRFASALAAAAGRVSARWHDSGDLPAATGLLDPSGRQLLDRHTDRLRPDLVRGEDPALLAAGLLIAADRFDRPQPAEAGRIRSILTDTASAGPAHLAAIAAARRWAITEAFDPLLDQATHRGQPISIRAAAAGALPACRGQRSLLPLTEILAAPDLPDPVQAAVLEALSLLGPVEVAEFARALFDRSPNDALRRAALHLIAADKDDRTVDFLVSSLPRLEGIAARIDVVVLIESVGSEHARRSLAQEVVGFGGHPGPVLEAAVGATARLARRQGALAQTLEPILRNPALPIGARAEAAHHLSSTDEAIGRALVEELTAGPDRVAAARLLARVASAPGRAQALTDALAHPDPALRQAAALALAETGPRPREVLLDLAGRAGEPIEVRAAALAALAAAGEDPIALAGDDADLVRAVVEGLLSSPVDPADWESYEVAGGADFFGRRTLRLVPRRLLDDARRRWHLPLEADSDARLTEILSGEVTVRIAPPFVDRRELLEVLLTAAGLELRQDWTRLVVGVRY